MRVSFERGTQLGSPLPYLLGRAHGGASNKAAAPLHALLERVHGLQTGDRERRVKLRDHHQGFFGALVVETRKRFGEKAGERYRILCRNNISIERLGSLR